MTELMCSPKIKPEHLARKAIVYLRQSSEKQVRRRRCREQGPQLRLREGSRLPGLPQELRRTARHTHASRAQERPSSRHEVQGHTKGHCRGGVDRVSQAGKAMILPENQWREGNGASHRLYLDTRSTVTLWACKPLSSYRTAGPFPPRAP